MRIHTVIAALFLTLARVSSAQDSAATRRECSHPRPLPRCRTFWTFELEYAKAVVATAHRVSVTFPEPSTEVVPDVDHFLVWRLGFMRNRDARSAAGVALDAGLSGQGLRFAFHDVRRRWIDNNTTFERTLGLASIAVFHPSPTSDFARRIALTAGAELAFEDLIAATLRADVAPGRKTNAALYAGAQLRSGAGLVGTALIGVGLIVLFAALSDSNY